MSDLILLLGTLGLFGVLGGATWLNNWLSQQIISNSKKKQEGLIQDIKKAQEDLKNAKIETKKKVEQQDKLTPENVIDFWKNRK